MLKKRKKKYKSVITKRIVASVKKLGVALICFVFMLSFYGVKGTNSAFIDVETSNANSFSASTLDISVSSETAGFSPAETSENMLADEEVERSFEVSNVGTENVKYRIEFVKNSGDDALCGAMQLEAERNSLSVFDGDLSSFDETDFSINSGEDDSWEMTISLPEDAERSLQELDCDFNFEFNSWLESKTEITSGWNDREELTGNEIHAGSWQDIVLNEFVPNPIGADNAPMPVDSDDETGEWVELYNRGDAPVDVSGWFLYDEDNANELEISASNSDSNGIMGDSGETIVPVDGFLVVYRNGDADFSLDDDGDSLRLFDGEIGSGANLIDSHSYAGSDFDALSDTLLESNVNDSTGGANASIPEGKSFIRYPDGFDHWIDPIPTPGKANDDENGVDELLEYYKKACFDEKGRPICKKDFMEALGILENKEEELDLIVPTPTSQPSPESIPTPISIETSDATPNPPENPNLETTTLPDPDGTQTEEPIADLTPDSDIEPQDDSLEDATDDVEEDVEENEDGNSEEEKAQLEAQEKARAEADAKAKQEAEEKAKLEADAKAKADAQEKAKKAEEEKAEAEKEKAKKEAEEEAKKEAAKKAAEEKAKEEDVSEEK